MRLFCTVQILRCSKSDSTHTHRRSKGDLHDRSDQQDLGTGSSATAPTGEPRNLGVGKDKHNHVFKAHPKKVHDILSVDETQELTDSVRMKGEGEVKQVQAHQKNVGSAVHSTKRQELADLIKVWNRKK